MPLTPKQQRFCDEYLVDLNATQAAVRSGYSVKTADRQGHRLLRNAEVRAYVARRRGQLAGRAELDAAYVLARLRLEAERTGEDASHSARVAALNLLGKHLGMFVDKVEVKTTARLVVEEEVVGGDRHADDPAAPRPV